MSKPQEKPIDYSEYTHKSLETLRREQTRDAWPEYKPTESEKEYWERIRKMPDTNAPASSLSDVMRNMMKARTGHEQPRSPLSFEDGKKLMWQIIKADEQERGYKYEFTDSIKAIIPELIRYFLGDPESKYSLSKGLYLWGNVGRGKTQLFYFFRLFSQYIKLNQFEITSAKKIVYDVSKEKDTAGMEYYFGRHVCFDDLGFEENKYKHFGNELRIMETILEQRYNRRIRTHATSNVPPDHLNKYYDDRIVSRCSEMFNFIEIKGTDHRKV